MMLRLSALVLFSMMMTACSYNGIYRSQYSDMCSYQEKGDCPQSALQIGNADTRSEYRLGFIEYDDQGQLRQRGQQESVIDHYLGLAGKQDVIVVTYIHGWHHSAQPEDGNVQEFRELLAKVSASEAASSDSYSRDRRPVLGVYVGWRGDSLDIGFLNHITFWDRKSTAHEVGHKGVTEALLKLEELVNVRNTFKDGDPPSTSRLVVIGHSFGGAVAFSSLQKILADRFVNSRVGKSHQDTAEGFGNLVILMNPAFEAMRFSSLMELSQDKCRSYFPGQLPRLVILTSESDDATRLAFPAGRVFSTLFESHRVMERHECPQPGMTSSRLVKVSQSTADRSTVGHFEPYQTHRLEPIASEAGIARNFSLEKAYLHWSAHDNSVPGVYTTIDLVSKKRTTPRNPYMNIIVDEELMDGHNDIWGDGVIGFINELIMVSTTPLEVYEALIAK